MKMTGAPLVRHALENIGIKYTFGIPGVHTTEIYDELEKSETIQPILVSHELGASFMADAISRTSPEIGTIVTVPAAGTTHAASGICEAYLDGIPMLIISGGVRRDNEKFYQLHQIDQEVLTKGMVKKYFLVLEHKDIIPTIYKAYDLANDGVPGPVFIEIASNLLLLQGEVESLPNYTKPSQKIYNLEKLDEVVKLLTTSKKIGIYVGWGARSGTFELIQLAEYFNAPVSTTMQGLSVFPASHPLHTGMGFGASAVPASQNAFFDCDTILAVGCRFAELATGSYGIKILKNLIHVDIDKEVFNKNFKATISLESDAQIFFKALLNKLPVKNSIDKNTDLIVKIKSDKENYLKEWLDQKNSERVTPGKFFSTLNNKLTPADFVVADDGNHTFLCGELLKIEKSGHFICPTDFNAMGYCVPAAIGAKLVNSKAHVCAIVGDGGFLMTALEIITAKTYNLGVIFFVFHDGELGQISQFQKIPLNTKTCTVLGALKVEGIAMATGAHYLLMNSDTEVEKIMEEAFLYSLKNIPVIVDVKIDYSKKTNFTKGVVKTNLSRFPLKDKIRFLTRAIKRHTIG